MEISQKLPDLTSHGQMDGQTQIDLESLFESIGIIVRLF